MTTVTDVLLKAQEIDLRVKQLGEEISRDFAGKKVILVCVLKGSYIFAADLARAIDLHVEVEFMRLSSYGADTVSNGKVNMVMDIDVSLEGENVIIVEDIVDTGITLFFLRDHLEKLKPTTLKVCSLLHKPARQKVEVPIDYLGFTIDDKFVVGYGLDFDERYRNLPYIGVLPS